MMLAASRAINAAALARRRAAARAARAKRRRVLNFRRYKSYSKKYAGVTGISRRNGRTYIQGGKRPASVLYRAMKTLPRSVLAKILKMR